MNGPNDPQSKTPPPGTPEKPPVPTQPESLDDAGSQALSEALRSSFAIVKVIMLILVVVFLGSGFFTVSSQERAIVLRFGKPVGTGEEQLLGPGAHWSWPYPIDEVVKIPYSQFQSVRSTTGWYATTPEAEATNTEPLAGPSLNPAADGFTLTNDGNIIHVRATMRYRILQPLSYALDFVNASNIVQNALNSAIFYASAHYNVDEALVSGIQSMRERIEARVKDLVVDYGLGITIDQLEMQTIAPRYVEPKFAAVLAAEQERRHTNQLAQTYASRTRNAAQGEAQAIINSGETERTRLLQAVAAEANYFTNQLPYYRANPELFVSRLQVETLHRILTNATLEKQFVTDSPDGTPMELRLLLSREPIKPEIKQP